MALKDNCHIMQEIAKAEQALNESYARVELLEKQLHTRELPDNKKEVVRKELAEVRKLLVTNEKQLYHLRTHNRKSFVFVAALLFIIFTLYVLYVLIFGTDVN